MFQHVVHAQNGDAALLGQCRGGERCGQSLAWIFGATGRAQKTFATKAGQHGNLALGDFAQAAQQCKVVIDTFSKSKSGVNDNMLFAHSK